MEIINKILNINFYTELQEEYKDIVKQIHPDKCNHPKALDAFQRLQKLKDVYEMGISFKDDFGLVSYKNGIVIKEKKNDGVSKHYYTDTFLSKYLPIYNISNNQQLLKEYTYIGKKVLPEEHVRWILSRLLEFCTFLYDKFEMIHLGLHTESFLINPNTHGLAVISFYHSKKEGMKIDTVSGRNMSIYPSNMIRNKIATPDIDVILCKSIAVKLLGDQSGIGTKLKKDYPLLIEWIQKKHENPVEAFLDYKEFIQSNYKSKFYKLILE